MAERGAGPGREGRPPEGGRARRGLALPLVLLLLLALTALSHGVLLLALQDRAASRASRSLLQARLLAEAAVRQALAELGRDTVRSPLGPLLSGEVPGGAYAVEARRMGRELLWVEGSGTASLGAEGPLRAAHRTARIAWALSPLERVAAFRAALEHGGGLLSFSPQAIDGSRAGEAGELASPRGCRDLAPALDSILPGGTLPPSRPLSLAESLRPPALGLLPFDTLAALVPLRTGGTVTPAPSTEEGICFLDDPGNWGSPSDPEGPCGGYRPALAAPGDLRLEGGEGQGLLIVAGDLTLEGGALYSGLVLVGGNLVLGTDATVAGLVRVRGRVLMGDGARVQGLACPALLALAAQAPLRRAIPLPASGWLGPL